MVISRTSVSIPQLQMNTSLLDLSSRSVLPYSLICWLYEIALSSVLYGCIFLCGSRQEMMCSVEEPAPFLVKEGAEVKLLYMV